MSTCAPIMSETCGVRATFSAPRTLILSHQCSSAITPGPGPDPGPDTKYLGIPSMHFGLGGYPLGGLK